MTYTNFQVLEKYVEENYALESDNFVSAQKDGQAVEIYKHFSIPNQNIRNAGYLRYLLDAKRKKKQYFLIHFKFM